MSVYGTTTYPGHQPCGSPTETDLSRTQPAFSLSPKVEISQFLTQKASRTGLRTRAMEPQQCYSIRGI
ncbi:hypothetical protein QJS04_geneDACA019118 [Acorus gramineus]|uniref:Uncharacterized protein n=1 Tax=Acorus gramineus TaxID=55184 RepID=A0AAV9A9R3_ACOGR|nr:hypothetical protein QJS04_geneDACA019118 [Acorus gramineus]